MILRLLVLAIWASKKATMLAVIGYLLAHRSAPRKLVTYLTCAIGFNLAFGVLVLTGLAQLNLSTRVSEDVSAVMDLAFGAALFAIGVVATAQWIGRGPRKHKEHQRADRVGHWVEATLETPRLGSILLVAIVTNLPGAAYIVALKDMADGSLALTEQFVLLLLFNAVMFSWGIAAVLITVLRPDRAHETVDRATIWLEEHGRAVLSIGGLAIGGSLVGYTIAGMF